MPNIVRTSRWIDREGKGFPTLNSKIREITASTNYVGRQGTLLDVRTSDLNREVVDGQVRGGAVSLKGTVGAIMATDELYTGEVTTDGTTYTIPIKTTTGTKVPFDVGDIIKSESYNSAKGAYSTILIVNEKDDVSISCLVSEKIGDEPSTGTTFVRIGNIIDPSRRGYISFNGEGPAAPSLDIINDVSVADSSGNLIVRLGRLDNLTDSNAGLDGTQKNYFGLYTDNAHLKGHLFANSGAFSTSTTSDKMLLEETRLTMYLQDVSYLQLNSDTDRWGSELHMRDTNDPGMRTNYTAAGIRNKSRSNWGDLGALDWMIRWDSGDVAIDASYNLQSKGKTFTTGGENLTGVTVKDVLTNVTSGSYIVTMYKNTIDGPGGIAEAYISAIVHIYYDDYNNVYNARCVTLGSATLTIAGNGSSASNVDVRISNMNASHFYDWSSLRIG